MNDWLVLLLMFLSGALLAVMYLGGLWLTAQRVQHDRHLALWLLTSLLVRMLLLMVAFYFILGDGHWQRLLAALVGFVTLRTFTTRRVHRQGLGTNTNNDKEKQA